MTLAAAMLWTLCFFLTCIYAQQQRGAITGLALSHSDVSLVYLVGTCHRSNTQLLYQIGDGDQHRISCNGDDSFRIPIPLDDENTMGEPIYVAVDEESGMIKKIASTLWSTAKGFFYFIWNVLRMVFRFFGLDIIPAPPTKENTDAIQGGEGEYRVPALLSQLHATTTNNDDDIIIPPHHMVLWDDDIIMETGLLLVQGTLLCPITTTTAMASTLLRTQGVVVTGQWICETDHNWTIELTGYRNAEDIVQQSQQPTVELGPRAIVAIDGGILRWTGQSGKEGFYHLQRTVYAGDSTIYIDNTAIGWAVGDEIVIAPTDFDPHEAEKRTIVAVSGQRVELDAPLHYKHWGATELYRNGKGLSWTLDERAEVFNVRRNIRVTAVNDDLTANSLLGGHIMVRDSASAAYIDNVELYQLGQAGRLGRYPFHWHLAGNVEGQFIKHSSIHTSFQRCIAVHQTHNAKIEGNSCYDHLGHGFFLEDGNERGNQIIGNIGVLSKMPDEGLALLASDITGDRFRFAPTTTFWISHPDNVVRDNVAAGSEGSGFWMAFVDHTGDGISPSARPRTTNTLVFDNNKAHSMVVGITHDGAPTGALTGNPRNPNDRALESAHYDPPDYPVFRNLQAYKCSGAGLYFRGSRAAYQNAVLADNFMSVFLATDQELERSLVVGISDNHDASSALPRYSGAMIYDGPLYLDAVHFANFNSDATRAFDKVAPASMWTSQVQGITFHDVSQRIQSLTGGTVWADEACSSVHDVDGSLTGTPGQLVVPAHPWNEDHRCVDPGTGFYNTLFCRYQLSYMILYDLTELEGDDLGFSSKRVRIADGSEVSLSPNSSSFLRNKLSMIHSGYRYSLSDLDFSPGQQYRLTFFTSQKGSLSPTILLENIPSSCGVRQGLFSMPQRDSVTQLEQMDSAGTFHDGTNLLLKLESTFDNPKMRSDTFRGQGNYKVQC